MGSPTHETNGNHKNRSDLAQIRGIGVVRKRWLNSLGINTIADLAQASADAIEAHAKREGRPLSRDEVEEWIAQAQVHHAEASSEPTKSSSHEVEAIASGHAPNRLEQETGGNPDLTDWEPIASFKVTYQTRQSNGQTEQRLVAHHLETDVSERWPNFETDLIQPWMRDRVTKTRPPLEAEPPSGAASVMADITQLRVMQPHYMNSPMVADKNTPIFLDAIHTTEPFALEVSMHFDGLSEAYQEKQVAYRVQCLARNLATGETDSLGEVTAHVSLSNDSLYKVLLPSLQLRQPGTYRLKVLVTLQHPPAALGHFKVPMLQVV